MRVEKILWKLIGRTGLENALNLKLDRLSQEEARMAVAENLRITSITHSVCNKVNVVNSKVECVEGVGVKVEEIGLLIISTTICDPTYIPYTNGIHPIPVSSLTISTSFTVRDRVSRTNYGRKRVQLEAPHKSCDVVLLAECGTGCLVEVAGCINDSICLQHDLTCDYHILIYSLNESRLSFTLLCLLVGASSQRHFILRVPSLSFSPSTFLSTGTEIDDSKETTNAH